MARMPGVAFIAPRSFSSGRPEGPPRLIVLHYTAGHEGPNDAENGAAYDKVRTDGTSAHFHVDSNSIVQCVDTASRSHTALWHGNMYGIHIEMAGTRQTQAQWLDEVSRATIFNTARIVAWAMTTHNIPLRRLLGSAIRPSSARGICDHNDCTVAWPEDGGTHTDVGPEFPWDVLFVDVMTVLAGGDMSLADDVWNVQMGSASLGIPAQAMGQWVKSLMAEAKGANDALDSLTAALAVVTTSLADAHAKLDAIAVAAGDPDAAANRTADVLSARLAG